MKRLVITQEVRNAFPGLKSAMITVKGVKSERKNHKLEEIRGRIIKEIKKKYSLESLKDVAIFRAYRNFYWRLGIDPTKTRPASEALIRRVLRSGSIPSINGAVDACNLASMETGISLSALDEGKVVGDLSIRFAFEGEVFFGVGMKKPIELKGDEIVIADEEGAVGIYPYRDSDRTKITNDTRDVIYISCGVPGIDEELLLKAVRKAAEYLIEVCGGEVEGELLV